MRVSEGEGGWEEGTGICRVELLVSRGNVRCQMSERAVYLFDLVHDACALPTQMSIGAQCITVVSRNPNGSSSAGVLEEGAASAAHARHADQQTHTRTRTFCFAGCQAGSSARKLPCSIAAEPSAGC